MDAPDRASLPADVASWTPAQVLAWLESIGASRYAERFRRNHVSGTDLLSIKEQDLVGLGVDDPINRRRMFLAIEGLRAGHTSALPSLLSPTSGSRKRSILFTTKAEGVAVKSKPPTPSSTSRASVLNAGPPSSKSAKVPDAVAELSEQLDTDEVRYMKSLIADLATAVEKLKSLKQYSFKEHDYDEEEEVRKMKMKRRRKKMMQRRQKQLAAMGAGLTISDPVEDPNEVDDSIMEPEPDLTMFSAMLEEVRMKREMGLKRGDRFADLTGPKEVLDPKEVADEYRLDLKFKLKRRNSRIVEANSEEEFEEFSSTNEMSNDEDEENPADEDALAETKEVVKQRIMVIMPTNPWRVRWDLMIMLCVLYFVVMTPVDLAFGDPIDNFAFDIVLDCVFIFDLVLNFFTAYRVEDGKNKGRMEVRPKEIAREYFKFWFWIDAAATIPLDLIIPAVGVNAPTSFNKLLRLFRGFKLARVLKLSRITKRLGLDSTYGGNPGLIRLTKYIVFLLVVWHYMGCAYWGVSLIIGFGNSSWTPRPSFQEAPMIDQYLQAYYWSILATTSAGSNIQPDTDVATGFSIAMVIFGCLLYASVIGVSSVALDAMDGGDADKRNKMQALGVFLKNQYEMDPRLKSRIIQYYDYVLSNAASSDDLMHDLHSRLKLEVDMELNQKLIEQVPMFNSLSEQCLLAIISSLEPKTYVPKEYICLKGERSLEMFFVQRGRVEILDGAQPKQDSAPGDKSKRSRVFLKEGGYFCDRCMLENLRCEYTVQATSHCLLLSLHRESLKAILRRFPEFAISMQGCALEDESLRGWTKIRFVVRNVRMLALVGSRIGFEEVFRRFNEEKEIRKTIRWAEPTGRRSGTAALLRQLTNRFSSGSSGERNGDFQNVRSDST